MSIPIQSFEVALPDFEMDFGDLPAGECRFLRGPEMYDAVPDADKLVIRMLEDAQEKLDAKFVILAPYATSVWVMPVQGPGYGIGDHVEGYSYTYTILVALNSIPEDAGGLLRVVGADEKFPHYRGRAVIFPGMVLHGNEKITKPVLRVTLAAIVKIRS